MNKADGDDIAPRGNGDTLADCLALVLDEGGRLRQNGQRQYPTFPGAGQAGWLGPAPDLVAGDLTPVELQLPKGRQADPAGPAPGPFGRQTHRFHRLTKCACTRMTQPDLRNGFLYRVKARKSDHDASMDCFVLEEKGPMTKPHTDLSGLAGLVLDWFDRNARQFAWRPPVGAARDPYHVWLSEIMLQQTTTQHAAPYFEAFTRRWPSVEDLAAAPDEDVMRAWAGLGYYARARNLLRCARIVAARGGFPATAQGLRALPGIGPYTAGAVAALAFGERVAAVDGNVERIFARLLAMEGAWAQEKKRIGDEVARLVPAHRPGDFAEALMDLGATVCTPAAPGCARCPVSSLCLAHQQGNPGRYPIKPVKPVRPVRYGHAFVLSRGGNVWIVRNPPRGLLGSMPVLPSGGWQEGEAPDPVPPAPGDWQQAGEVRHVFTHFSLRLTVWSAQARSLPDGEGRWAKPGDDLGLPSVFAKALALVYPGEVTLRRR